MKLRVSSLSCPNLRSPMDPESLVLTLGSLVLTLGSLESVRSIRPFAKLSVIHTSTQHTNDGHEHLASVACRRDP